MHVKHFKKGNLSNSFVLMISRTIQKDLSLKHLLLVLICLFTSVAYSSTEKEIADKRIAVAMRMIGHEVLRCVGDPESRVMPVEKSGEQYKISFELEFGFDPEDMVSIIEDIMTQTGIARNYLVEVEQCDNKEIVHSFMIVNSAHASLIPCEGRMLPEACHNFLITVWEDSYFIASPPDGSSTSLNSTETGESHPFRAVFIMFPLLMLAGFVGYFIRKRHTADPDPHLTRIGDSRFDRKNRRLSFGDQSVELSHKEAELLSLLHTHANATVAREVLLRKVWADEGDYVGRTLDVFISKLRKKLEADTRVKIVNTRGVGYKLVV
jgi:hypothetical protein